MNFFDLLRRKKTEKEQKVSTTWTTLVVSVANGKADELNTLRVLDELGRSVEELEAAVALVQRRRQIRERVIKGQMAPSEIQKIETQMEKATAAFTPIQTKYEQECETLNNHRRYWLGIEQDSQQATEELIRSATDGEVLATFQAVQARQTELGNLVGSLTEQLREVQSSKGALAPEQTDALARVAQRERELNRQLEEARGNQRTVAAEYEIARQNLAKSEL